MGELFWLTIIILAVVVGLIAVGNYMERRWNLMHPPDDDGMREEMFDDDDD